jgi:hypothetical protein
MAVECRMFSLSSFLEHQTGYSGRFTAQGLLHECVLRRPLFLCRIDLLEACFHYSSTRPTYGWSCDLPEGRGSSFVLPDPDQVGGSSRSTSCLHFDLLGLHSRSSMFYFVHTLEGFLFLDPRAPYVTLAVPCLRFAST